MTYRLHPVLLNEVTQCHWTDDQGGHPMGAQILQERNLRFIKPCVGSAEAVIQLSQRPLPKPRLRTASNFC